MRINIENLETNYLDKGEGEVLLLLHGWGSSIELFINIVENQSISKRIIAVDMPGFGQTQEPDKGWNVDDYVNFIINFIKALNIKELSILGHSFGGRVIIKLVNRKDLPFKVKKLVLVDSAGIKAKQKKVSAKVKFFKIAKKILSNKLMLKLLPGAIDKLKNKFGSEDYKNASPVMRETLVKVLNEDLTELLPTIKQPTLLFWGDKDTATPIEDAKLMEKLIPDSGLVVVEGAGHYSFLENPYLANSVINVFIKEEK